MFWRKRSGFRIWIHFLSCVEDATLIFIMICRKNTSYNQLWKQKYYTFYLEENLSAFTTGRMNLTEIGSICENCSNFWNICEEQKNTVVYELNWIRKCSWSWKTMEKAVQINCYSIHDRNRKNDSIKRTD